MYINQIPNSPLCVFAPIFICPLVIFLFLSRVRMFPKNDDKNYLLLSKKIAGNEKKNVNDITFFKTEKGWKCEVKGFEYEFNLKGYLYKKSFIIAYVTRAIRYSTVSNKLFPNKLVSLRLKLLNKKLTCNVYFCDKDKNRKYVIAKNGISRLCLLSFFNNYSYVPYISHRFDKIKYDSPYRLDEEIVYRRSILRMVIEHILSLTHHNKND